MIQRLGDFGMLGVLLLLCLLFSALTLREQSATDPQAARDLVATLLKENPEARIWIATLGTQTDKAFGAAAVETLREAGVEAAGVLHGSPAEARQELQRLNTEGQALDAIIVTPTTASWLLLRDLDGNFPELGDPPLRQAEAHTWPAFLQPGNLLNVANQIAVIAIVAIGMTLVILAGGIDLSVGSLIALSAVLVAWGIRHFGATEAGIATMVLSSVASILLCGGLGWVSGLFATRGRMPPFIVTLAMMLIASGAAYLIADGQSIHEVPESFIWLGRGADLFGIPNAVVLMILLYLLAHAFMKHTRLGRHLYAVGGNRDAALISGIPVNRVIRFSFITCGALAGLGGVIMASQLKSGSPTYGQMYELKVIAAVVVGGASLSGGRGHISGTLIGAFIIAVIENGMNLTNIESYTQKIVLGAVILGAVGLDQWRRKN